MKDVTAIFILTLPLAILWTDFLVWRYFGYPATITGVVRGWSDKSIIPELAFLGGGLLLYLHLFRM